MPTDTAAGPLLARARAAIPGHDAAAAALPVIAQRIAATAAVIRPEVDVADAATSAVLAGSPVPDPADLADAVLAQRGENERADAGVGALQLVRERLAERLRDLRRDEADQALAVVRRELIELLADARPLAAGLNGITDPGDAIEAGMVEPWQQFGRLAERYTEIRAAQRVLTAGNLNAPDQPTVTDRVGPDTRRLVDSFGIVRDPHRHGDPTVRPDGGRVASTRIVNGRVVETTGTERAERGMPWVTGDPRADLAFACRDGVAAWVPTVGELQQAADDHLARAAEAARAAAQPARSMTRASGMRARSLSDVLDR